MATHVECAVPLTAKLSGSPLTTSSSVTVERSVGERPHQQKLDITFQRTVRVSDNGEKNYLPPSLGSFPLYDVADLKEILPASVAAKGGFLLPMYQREAMWINFASKEPFAVKVYVGGVNAISAEPAKETEETMMRRLKLLQRKQCVQDYLVTPDQLWLDGIASEDGMVRQFVAMPLGTGYSVEAQITGEETTGGLQIEVTPYKVESALMSLPPPPPPPVAPPPRSEGWTKGRGSSQIFCKTLTGSTMTLEVYSQNTIDEESTIHLVLLLRGGGGVQQRGQMSIAAGGLIEQVIDQDTYDPTLWDRDCGTIFNVQILNSESFAILTGKVPPTTPITASTYAQYGCPYLQIWDEKTTGVVGKFGGVKSVNEMDIENKPSMEKSKAIADVIQSTHNPIVLLNSAGREVGFRTVSDMEKAVRERFAGMGI
ncbi:hypothetical protein LTR49_028541 [Elasticomyces elasticus]|nr:hypothetical protein LTR49_028541 [Elasticomyces elasticus]KAK5726240.1 hypothetical protein LTS12_027464 [Elasticomyces elasticus]